MALSSTTIKELFNTYTQRNYVSNNNLDYDSSLLNNDAYSLFMIFDKKKDSFEIPISYRKECESILNNLIEGEEETKFIIPLYYNSKLIVNTFNKLIKEFSKTYSLIKVILEDKFNTEFYFNKGLILDKDYTPLFMTSISFNYDSSINRYKVDKLLCRINPIVFTDDKPLYKLIVKDLLPFYASNNFRSDIYSISKYIYYKFDNIFNPVTIIIESFDYMFKKVIPPKDIPNINNTINDYLSDNADVLLNMT